MGYRRLGRTALPTQRVLLDMALVNGRWDDEIDRD